MISNLSTRLWFATTSIPAIRAENILPVLTMLILWIGLRHMGVQEERAFVMAVVVAEAYAIWRNLPDAAFSLRKVRSGKPGMLMWPVLGLVTLAAVQLWLNDPLFTQRVLSGMCVFFLVIMILGIRREKDMLERVVPQQSADGKPVERVSLLRVNALAAAMVIAVNELLIAGETLAVWITVMPVFVLFLHGFYWFMVLMVLPPQEKVA
ncbi:MAG: hypothetical protein ACQEVT_13470 [Pseudomonadota bacterium]|uniref:hypothetical protein n=1 Tax=Roseovarius TaxID=74030 RepID=UPI0022A81D5D|nr:hypothetical protein [Roseovarius sp. EGI FJ00037]MCZ0813352.1 hypothetical protein [Roseovarius sp. EGI FJ00037]